MSAVLSTIPRAKSGFAFSTSKRSPERPEIVGGDFVAVERFFDGSVSFVIGDLWAKSVQGEYHAHRLRQTFRQMSSAATRPAEILAGLNRRLHRDLASMHAPEGFAAVTVGAYAPDGTLTYAAAGIEPGVLFRTNGVHLRLASTGPLLGLEVAPEFGELGGWCRPGDLLVVYTDGVDEARCAGDHERRLGAEGVIELVRDAIET